MEIERERNFIWTGGTSSLWVKCAVRSSTWAQPHLILGQTGYRGIPWANFPGLCREAKKKGRFTGPIRGVLGVSYYSQDS